MPAKLLTSEPVIAKLPPAYDLRQARDRDVKATSSSTRNRRSYSAELDDDPEEQDDSGADHRATSQTWRYGPDSTSGELVYRRVMVMEETGARLGAVGGERNRGGNNGDG